MSTGAEGRSEIRRARQRHGVGLRELARVMGVTPGAVSQWERGEAAGTAQIGTVARALHALGETLTIRGFPTGRRFVGRLERREDRVTLELHRAVARKLLTEPETVLGAVPDNLSRLRAQVNGSVVNGRLTEWEQLSADQDIPGLIAVMLGLDDRSIAMRQTSPFMGVLSPRERYEAIERASA